MTASRGSPLLAYVFASPLVKETWRGDPGDAEFAPIRQRNYASEREVIASALKSAHRGVHFCSAVASAQNFLFYLRGCRVLHFTWNGEPDEEQVVLEDERGLASPLTDDQFHTICRRDILPEAVVLSAASAKLVAGAFVRAGIPNVVASETRDGDQGIMLSFIRTFYSDLARGCTLKEAFDAGVLQLPEHGDVRERCVLLSEEGIFTSIAPFDDAGNRRYTDLTLRSPSMRLFKQGSVNFLGREVLMQEVYMHMVQRTKVVTITGFPGIGKTEVALQACRYARERRLFGKMFFVSFKDQATGAPITAMSTMEKRLAQAFGVSPQDVARPQNGLVGCIIAACGYNDECLLVLDACPPWLVDDKGNRIVLSTVVEQLCQWVPKLQYLVTMVSQVGIAREKVVNVDRLSAHAAAELFVASAPRRVTVPELIGGLPVQRTDCPLRTFSTGGVVTALGGHPGAIIAVSKMLGTQPLEGLHLLFNEREFVQQIIPAQLGRYNDLDAEFTGRVEKSRQEPDGSTSGFAIDVAWRGVFATKPLDGSRLWKVAAEKYAGEGASLRALPWEALYKHALRDHFFAELGDEGKHRPLQDEDFKSLGANDNLWESPDPPERRPAKMVERDEFLKNFWPWFEAMTFLIKRTGHWGNTSFPVIRDLTTLTSKEGEALLEGKPKGTFLVRVSTRKRGCLVIMFVDGRRKVMNVPTAVDDEGNFRVELISRSGSEVLNYELGELILHIKQLTHLLPDIPKDVVFGGHR